MTLADFHTYYMIFWAVCFIAYVLFMILCIYKMAQADRSFNKAKKRLEDLQSSTPPITSV